MVRSKHSKEENLTPRETTSKQKSRPDELAHLLRGIGVPTALEFQPDPFQLEAIDLVTNQNCDVLVTAPTGSGKTWIATEAIKKVLAMGSRAWYTSPLKALSNDKFREFSHLFGAENVGILTGDRKINSAAPLIVATTEIYRNALYDAMNQLELMNARLVVLDEVHYLSDRDRGVVWEEAIIYSPSVISILMLSATAGNGGELAEWVAWARGSDCRLVSHPQRPVPLRTGFINHKGDLLPLSLDGKRLHPEIHALYHSRSGEEKKPHRSPKSRNMYKFRNR